MTRTQFFDPPIYSWNYVTVEAGRGLVSLITSLQVQLTAHLRIAAIAMATCSSSEAPAGEELYTSKPSKFVCAASDIIAKHSRQKVTPTFDRRKIMRYQRTPCAAAAKHVFLF
jgi:hypothetical protein